MVIVSSEHSLVNIVKTKVCNYVIHVLYFFRMIDRYDEFRQGCCDFMQKADPEFFKSFMDDISLEEYVENMRTDGTWGTQLEIVSLCKMYDVNCVIFRPDGLHYTIECDNPDNDDCRILLISHHDEEHFNEVRFKEKGRILTSFNELELLLTELNPSDKSQEVTRLSKKEARQKKRDSVNPKKPQRQAPQIIVSDNHKLINL